MAPVLQRMVEYLEALHSVHSRFPRVRRVNRDDKCSLPCFLIQSLAGFEVGPPSMNSSSIPPQCVKADPG